MISACFSSFGKMPLFTALLNAPRLELGFGSRLGLVLGLGCNQTIAPEENCPPVRVRGWVRVSFGVEGGNFP